MKCSYWEADLRRKKLSSDQQTSLYTFMVMDSLAFSVQNGSSANIITTPTSFLYSSMAYPHTEAQIWLIMSECRCSSGGSLYVDMTSAVVVWMLWTPVDRAQHLHSSTGSLQLLTTGRTDQIINRQGRGGAPAVNDLSILSSPKTSSPHSSGLQCRTRITASITGRLMWRGLLRSTAATDCCHQDGFFPSLPISD